MRRSPTDCHWPGAMPGSIRRLSSSIATVVPAPTTSVPRMRWTETWMRSWKRVCSAQSAGMSSVGSSLSRS